MTEIRRAAGLPRRHLRLLTEANPSDPPEQDAVEAKRLYAFLYDNLPSGVWDHFRDLMQGRRKQEMGIHESEFML